MDWVRVARHILRLPAHVDVTLPKHTIAHPKHAGFTEGIGEPQGQIGDYRRKFSGDRSLHVREFDDHFKVHWDKKDPDSDPLGHLVEDAPYWLFLGSLVALVIGGIIYAAAKGHEKSKNAI